MKTALLCLALTVVAVAGSQRCNEENEKHVCKVIEGKRMLAFSDDKIKVKFPCKYPAVRRTQCGDWKMTVTPGNAFTYTQKWKRGDVYTNTLWVALKNVKNGTEWKGRSSTTLADKYLESEVAYPFRKKDGDLDTGYFEFSDQSEENFVSIQTPDGDVKIIFWLYRGANAWNKESGVKIVCNSDTFMPSSFPTQICGNGQEGEAKAYKKSSGLNQHEAIMYSVFTTEGIAQTDTFCKIAEDIILNQCTTDEDRKTAVKNCWKFAIRGKLIRCVRRNSHEAMDMFTTCLAASCAGFDCDSEAVGEMKEAIDGCEDLGYITDKVKMCYKDLAVEHCTLDR